MYSVNFLRMSTVIEILEAVKHLSPMQKQEFVQQLESVLTAPSPNRTGDGNHYYLSPDFTTQLVEHFHRAKRAALGQS